MAASDDTSNELLAKVIESACDGDAERFRRAAEDLAQRLDAVGKGSMLPMAPNDPRIQTA